MLVCYVEGDRGHLLNEQIQNPTHRTRVRGVAHSFHMPWEDILTELVTHCQQGADEAMSLPRSPECLKCILNVHIKVNRQDMGPILRQLTVRPYVLVQLLYFLIEHNHEVFRNKGSMAELKDKVKEAVRRLYPVSHTEIHKPEHEQCWEVPPDLVDLCTSSTSAQKTRAMQFLRDRRV